MMKIIGRDDLVDDPRYATVENVKAKHLQPELIDHPGRAASSKKNAGGVAARSWPSGTCRVRRSSAYTDILKDDEAYVNDAIRKVKYNAFGEHALPTTPIRFGGYGDPPIILSKPIGYHTAEYLEQYGYTPEQIAELEEKGAVKCYHGEEVPDTDLQVRAPGEGRGPLQLVGPPPAKHASYLEKEPLIVRGSFL